MPKPIDQSPIPYDPEGQTLPDFPGMELFPRDQAEKLAVSIRNYRMIEPLAVRTSCQEYNVGQKEDESEDTLAIKAVERYIKKTICITLAVETMSFLGHTLAFDEISALSQTVCHNYENIPQAVYHAINAKLKE